MQRVALQKGKEPGAREEDVLAQDFDASPFDLRTNVEWRPKAGAEVHPRGHQVLWPAELVYEAGTVHLRHPVIDDQKIGFCAPLKNGQRLLRIEKADGRPVDPSQAPLDALVDEIIVVDDDQLFRLCSQGTQQGNWFSLGSLQTFQ